MQTTAFTDYHLRCCPPVCPVHKSIEHNTSVVCAIFPTSSRYLGEAVMLKMTVGDHLDERLSRLASSRLDETHFGWCIGMSFIYPASSRLTYH